MSIPRFFIDRPVFAMVLSLLIVLMGALAFFRLPLSEYPAVTPPTVQVTATYPGAEPQVIADTVARPIEQAVTGVEGMIYMSSQTATDGRMTLTATFAQGTDPDLAQVEVQNRVQRALSRLPEEVQRLGVVTQKVTPDILMVVHLVSPNGRYDPLYVSNYALLQVRDELARIPGVGDVVVWGAGEYAMRIWLDPTKLAARRLTATDVLSSLREQSIEAAAGSVGQSPDAKNAFQIAVSTQGRLSSVEEFRNVILRTDETGRVVRLGDVARVELGADSYALRARLSGREAVAIQILQSPDANALDVSAQVRTTMERLKREFPAGLEYRIAYDPTLFVRASLEAVSITLLEAVMLVVLVIVIFLQSWRASIIPLLAVPVSLIGTFAVLYLLGFSLNTLSLFGLVLSIGIVVDDAIVVVENVERHIEEGQPPLMAARRAMAEVTGPIIAISAVLTAVFVPTAFLSGLQGEFYRQFAVTVAVATLFSAVNSLTLSPALAALLFRPRGGKQDRIQAFLTRALGRFFITFDRAFERLGDRYIRGVQWAISRRVLCLLGYAVLVGLTVVGIVRTPAGFVPAQDKYYLVGIAQLPAGASLERTDAVVQRMSAIMLDEPGVADIVAFPGVSVNGFANLPNSAVVFAVLDPFEARRSSDLAADAIAGRLMGKLSQITDGFVGVFPPPPVPGLGNTGGFKLQVQDRSGAGWTALASATNAVIAEAAKRPELTGVMGSFEPNAPQVSLSVDRDRASAQGIPLSAIFATLQANLGSIYVNDFNRFGRTYRVYLQADAPFREQFEAVRSLYVRNSVGEMVPLSALVHIAPGAGPDRVVHYNGLPAADITGNAAPGFSSGQATRAMEEVLDASLPQGMSYEWTDLTFQEKAAGNTAMIVFPLAVLFAFLFLAAQYDSFGLPFAVLAIAPMAVLGALVSVWITGGDNNIFTQIAFVVLVGLAAKNAILIVEFARERECHGASPLEAVLEAAKLRLRPILMTSIAFIAGAIPLAMASGAGAEMRRAMGAAVLSGMFGVTLAGLFLTPVLYVFIRDRRRRGNPSVAPQALPAE